MPMAFGGAAPHRCTPQMIQLTKLNNQPFAVMQTLLKFVEQSPDTVLTLVSGEKIVVRESAEEVIRRVVEFRRVVLEGVAGKHAAAQQRVQSRVAPWIRAVLPVRSLASAEFSAVFS